MDNSKNPYTLSEKEKLLEEGAQSMSPKSPPCKGKCRRVIVLMIFLVGAIVLLFLKHGYELSSATIEPISSKPDQPSVVSSRSNKQVVHRPHNCNSVGAGYQCFSELTHKWGPYSPYFSLSAESSISDLVPQQCDVTFVQVLSRHGARYPTASKSTKYKALIEAIQANATAYEDGTDFLRTYNYTLGSDDLTTFGEHEMVNSGIKFYNRYENLTRNNIPFMRASGSSRVVQSGQLFIQGFQQSKKHDTAASHSQASPKINVVISEDTGSNNTLNHNTCPVFEASTIGDDATDNFTAIFAPSIQTRLQEQIPGVTLSLDDVTYLMDLCAFNTISDTSDGSTVSDFCHLFTDAEWSQYNYLQSLSKYYGYGAGNPLGPTQGVGFVNELIARLTHTPVHDHTSSNHTLDNGPDAWNTTFPVNRALYADFTHDNGLIPIFFALGLYNNTATLPTTHIQSVGAADGFSASWTVPFGARAYIEMMECASEPEPLVRVLVNDRVVPLQGCHADKLGRCTKGDFLNALSFAKEGGHWSSCYE
ncbi:Histidine phosphatase superfamily clade-2 [Penicillium malachiteum]|uniref:Histidine phosphatase superfamily clade-2 n=1 Tax=Penicillium malachiteum TaxID=1324776 RepID=UPI002547CE80|nr:Histidine phosphatase superfamily clade-2 [Penicillium malachiteum]KAJ5731343.1 Histidine phosphatase superfamily clade-2 [Penicillium malachiteum]